MVLPLRVFCYYNLHKNCFSLRALEGPNKGLVVAHADQVHLRDVQFKVSEAGRTRVLSSRVKNVHAGAVGVLVACCLRGDKPLEDWQRLEQRMARQRSRPVTYNPYLLDAFYDQNTGAPVWKAREAWFVGRSLRAIVG